MSHRAFAGSLLALLCSLPVVSHAAGLDFEERVRAQEAIERRYYSHQLEADRPFEAAVPRELLERKVRTYLQQATALGTYWNEPITADQLRLETERIFRDTAYPARLRAILTALDGDLQLFQETFVLPQLARRLARQRFVNDRGIHAEGRV